MGLLFSALLVSSCGKEAATGKSLDASPEKEMPSSERIFNAEMELRRAVKSNDTVALRLVIHENTDLTLNKYLEDGDTLLTLAIKKRFHLIRNILLEKGASAELVSLQADFVEQTPLMIAAHIGDSSAILALLNYGASLNAQDNLGDTPLHKAIKNGYDEAARTLIRAGANLQMENDRFESPLETAIALGRKDITIELQALVNLERGAPSIAVFRQILKDGDIVNYRKLVSLHRDVIKEYVSINPIALAAESSNEIDSFEIVQSLLALKISPDGPEKSETTPLIRAVTLKRKNIAELLVRANADLNKTDSTDRPALAYAILNNDEAMVELLVTNGAPERNGNFRGCRLAWSVLRKLTKDEDKACLRNILSRLDCRRSR